MTLDTYFLIWGMLVALAFFGIVAGLLWGIIDKFNR